MESGEGCGIRQKNEPREVLVKYRLDCPDLIK